MSLVSSFPSDPSERARIRKVDAALTVSYSKQTITGSWGWSNGLNGGGTITMMSEYHRYARKRYRYVGLTGAAMRACVRAMNALYERMTWANYWESSGVWTDARESGRVMTATVTPVANDDGSWDVEVDVNEDDVRHTMVSGGDDARTVFAFNLERARDYDGETEADLEEADGEEGE